MVCCKGVGSLFRLGFEAFKWYSIALGLYTDTVDIIVVDDVIRSTKSCCTAACLATMHKKAAAPRTYDTDTDSACIDSACVDNAVVSRLSAGRRMCM